MSTRKRGLHGRPARDGSDGASATGLAAGSQRFRNVADHAPVMIWTADTRKNGTWFNKRWLDYTGRTMEEERGDGWIEGVHSDDRKRCLDALHAAYTDRGQLDVEYRLRRFDGQYRWILDRGVPLTGDDGAFEGYIGSAIDIDDQKQVESALRESEERFKTLVDGSPVFIWLIGADADCQFANKAFIDFAGGSLEKILGTAWQHDIHPDDIGQCLDGFRAAYQNRGPFAAVLRMRRADGEWRWIDVHASPRTSRASDQTVYVAVSTDITARVMAEDNSQRYRLLSEHSNDIIWLVGPDGYFLDVNRTALETYGYTRDEFLAMNIRDIRHPSTLAQLNGQLDEAKTKGVHFETLHVRKDGTVVPVDVKANSAHIGGERIVISIVRDITAARDRERALRESEERRKLAQHAGNVGIFDWDIVAGKTYWSEMMWVFYGAEEREVNPDEKFWVAHLHPTDRERVKRHVRQAVRSDENEFRDEFRILQKDGSLRWIEAVAQISRDRSGTATRMYGVNMDVTQRKGIEEQIRLNENQLRLVMNSVPALISYVGQSERYQFVNQKFTEWFEKPSEALVGRKVREVIGLPAYRMIKPQIDAALSGKESAFERRLRFRRAGPRYVHGSFVPDIGIDGTVHGYYELTYDLTDLKLSQDLLRSSEERLGLLMDSLTEHAIFTLDRDGMIDSWNKGAEIIFGYTQREIIGQPGEILFTDEDLERKVPSKELRTARRLGRASDERWHKKKDGTLFFADGVTMPLFVGTELTGYAKIASDLTEKKRRDEELQRAHDELEIRVKERTKELVTSNFALVQEMEEREITEGHRTDLLRRLVSSQEMERRRIARDLHDQLGQRLTALRLKIASLLDVSSEYPVLEPRVQRIQEIAERLDSEVSFLAWELRPSALDDLGLTEAVGAFVREWSRHYETAADFRAGQISSERLNREIETHLYRITQEALNNIAKHALANHVTVLLESRDDSVILIIEDDGIGFETQEDSRPRESGKGLGLLGMRERASLIGGDVEIESASGSGTTIYVRVPFYNKDDA